MAASGPFACIAKAPPVPSAPATLRFPMRSGRWVNRPHPG